MVERWRRLLDLLQTIDMEPTFDKHPDEHRGVRMSRERLYKGELLEACLMLDLDVDAENTMAQMRRELREHLELNESKSMHSILSNREMFKVGRAINEYRTMEAHEIVAETHPGQDPTEDRIHFGWDQRIEINGEEYTVQRTKWTDDVHEDAGYEAFSSVMLDDDRTRMVLFFGWDPDNCRYRHSAALEERRGYEPYKRWKKVDYIKDIDIDFSMRNRLEKLEEGDEIKFDVVNVWLTVNKVNDGYSRMLRLYCTSSRGSSYQVEYDYRRNLVKLQRRSDYERWRNPDEMKVR